MSAKNCVLSDFFFLNIVGNFDWYLILFERDVNLTIEVLYEKKKNAFYIKLLFQGGPYCKAMETDQIETCGNFIISKYPGSEFCMYIGQNWKLQLFANFLKMFFL